MERVNAGERGTATQSASAPSLVFVHTIAQPAETDKTSIVVECVNPAEMSSEPGELSPTETGEKLTTIDDLSDKLLLKIFQNLSTEDIAKSVFLVSKRWRDVSAKPALWTIRTFTPPTDMSDWSIAICLKRMPELRHFYVKYAVDVNLILDHLCTYCPKIETIVMERRRGPCRQTLNKLFVKYPGMKRTDTQASGTEFQVDYALWFSPKNAAKRLTLFARDKIKSKCWGRKNCNELNIYQGSSQELNSIINKHKSTVEYLSVGANLVSDTFLAISECKQLKQLFLVHLQSQGINTNFRFLKDLKKLECLQISFWDIQYAGVYYSPPRMHLPCLSKLEIAYSGNHTNECISRLLSGSPALTHLKLQTNDLKDRGLETISNCNHLKHIDISFNLNLTNKSIEYIASNCPELKFLNVSFCFGMSQKLVEIISKCTELEELRIENLLISPKYLRMIPKMCPKIAVLSIRHCHFLTDRMLRDFDKDFKKVRLMTCSEPHLMCEGGYNDWPFCIPSDESFHAMLST